MNVVARSLMATGLLTYAGIHLLQGLNPPAAAPAWLQWAFVATAIVAVVLAFGLLTREAGHNTLWKDASAALAGTSAIALVLSVTTGLPGVQAMDLRAEALAVVAAEVVILGSWAMSRRFQGEYNEVDA